MVEPDLERSVGCNIHRRNTCSSRLGVLASHSCWPSSAPSKGGNADESSRPYMMGARLDSAARDFANYPSTARKQVDDGEFC
jgi:hypothetical protein